MKFEVLAERRFPPDNGPLRLFLVPDGWNDYSFVTMYDLWFRDGHGNVKVLGQVKIGRRGMTTHQRPIEPGAFRELNQECFSLGQDDSYYEAIRDLGGSNRISILKGLRDIAFAPEIFDAVIDEEVMQVSLLRSVERPTVENQFRRIAGGGTRLTDYMFRYTPPMLEDSSDGHPSKDLDFAVEVGANPPTNLHVLIGRNGSGKTTILRNIAYSLIHSPGPVTRGSTELVDSSASSFANCITVSFSAFDTFDLPLDAEADDDLIGRAFIGLYRWDGHVTEHPRNLGAQLVKDFGRHIVRVVESGKVERWLRAVRLLESDPHFERVQADSLLDPQFNQNSNVYIGEDELEDLREESTDLFGKLSAGHKIVLLTLTRLVETVAEGSIVLLDEPETHLHPPLLAAFIRALSDLLIDRNGVAIIATHSPVVLQEVPRRCVWKITGWDDFRVPERPTIETFGENVGVLTHEVFGLEVMESGFHNELQRAVGRFGTYEAVLDHFGGQLGSEAKGLVRVLLATAMSRRQS
ncbi:MULTISPECIES: AAA family ATPase [unclassified Streptomyces]|uniref:AAA family ATPase n=1 Tax=unclassified Streptomyces TaxID=2593676 RepID=UPI0004763229|nr:MULTISPECIES: AAA family ATPase [unclassified Streptomyces]MYQ81638.1 AAA family ATPase [Streptomyces sp. SID4923]